MNTILAKNKQLAGVVGKDSGWITASNYHVAGATTEIRFAIGRCSLGAILLAMSVRGICAILLDDDPDVLVRDLQHRFPRSILIRDDKEFTHCLAKTIEFVEAPTVGLDLPLDIQGTVFQQRVWQVLKEIPLGSTVSYTDIAKQIDAPTSVRAVARACAANPLAVAIPCHRVVRNDGSLSGYRWGIARKKILLKRETQK